MLQGLVLFRDIGDEAGAAACVRDHGAASLLAGNPETGRRETAEALVRCQACGDAQGVAWCYDVLGVAAFALGDYTEASSHFLEICQPVREPGRPVRGMPRAG